MHCQSVCASNAGYAKLRAEKGTGVVGPTAVNSSPLPIASVSARRLSALRPGRVTVKAVQTSCIQARRAQSWPVDHSRYWRFSCASSPLDPIVCPRLSSFSNLVRSGPTCPGARSSNSPRDPATANLLLQRAKEQPAAWLNENEVQTRRVTRPPTPCIKCG